VASSAMAGCAPRMWSDDAGFAIVGTAAAPEAEAFEPEPQKRVEVRDNKIVINEKVQFAFDSAKILPESFDLLNEVAKVIKENPQIKEILVEGHASAEGSDSHNMDLSKRRAKSVMDYLVKQGKIDKKMLKSQGFGETRHLVQPGEDERNRRVEFTITKQDVVEKKVEIDEQGNEKVIEEKKVGG
jgi:outer membrane protein OmpA-like peptidoglycan-associated protein